MQYGICGVLDAEVSFDSCIVIMRCLSSSTVLLMPFALSWKNVYLFVFCFGGLLFVSCVAVCGCEDVKS